MNRAKLLRAVLFLLGLSILFLPNARVLIGTMPLYLVDVLALALLPLTGMPKAFVRKASGRMFLLTGLFALALLPTTIAEFLRISPLEPSYLYLRTVLWMVTALAVVSTGLRRDRLHALLGGVAVGVLLTSLVAIGNSLPVSGPWVRANVLSINTINPTSESLMRRVERGVFAEDMPTRGDTLIGKSNITGCFVLAALPFLLALSRRSYRLSAGKRLFLQVTVALGLLAVLCTYSRAAYLGLAILLVFYAATDFRTAMRRLLPTAAVVGFFVLVVGFNSDNFMFDFVAEKFDLTNETYAENNMARIMAYTRPFEVFADDPRYLLRGAGRAFKKLRSEADGANILDLLGAEMHSVFAASVFYRGVAAMILIFLIYAHVLWRTRRLARAGRRARLVDAPMGNAAYLSLLTLLPAMAFDHYFVTRITGHLFLFLLLGLACATQVRLLAAQRERVAAAARVAPASEPAAAPAEASAPHAVAR